MAASQINSDFKGDHLSVKMFGALGDGVADDTAAFASAELATRSPYMSIYVPPGTYRVTSIVSTHYYFSMVGEGTTSVIMGIGDTGDILSVGTSVAETAGVYLRDFTVRSEIRKTSGAGVHLTRCVLSSVSGVIADGNGGNGYLWDGIWLDGVGEVVCKDFEAKAQNTAIRVNANSTTGSGVYIGPARILGSTIGLHIAGGIGGLYLQPDRKSVV